MCVHTYMEEDQTRSVFEAEHTSVSDHEHPDTEGEATQLKGAALLNHLQITVASWPKLI